jgi:arginase
MRDAGFRLMVERLGWGFEDNGDRTFVGYDEATKNRRVEAFRRWLQADTSESYEDFTKEVIRSPESVHVTRADVGDPYDNLVNGEMIARSCKAVYDEVRDAAMNGRFAMTIGGDHAIASATLSAMLEAYPDLAVIWVDAHADANTPTTSPSLHYHGMPAAHVMGWFEKQVAGFEWLKAKLPPQRLAYIGLRDIDAEEGQMLTDAGIRCFTMQQVDKLGISEVVRRAVDAVDPYHKQPLHLTFDIDAIDPAHAPGTGTLARGGLTYRESHYICEELATTNRLVGMDLVEVNPLVDLRPERMHGDDPDMAPTTTTVSLAMELCLSGLGKNILNQALCDHRFLAEPRRRTQERPVAATFTAGR